MVDQKATFRRSEITLINHDEHITLTDRVIVVSGEHRGRTGIFRGWSPNAVGDDRGRFEVAFDDAPRSFEYGKGALCERADVLIHIQHEIDWCEEPGRFADEERVHVTRALRNLLKEIQASKHTQVNRERVQPAPTGLNACLRRAQVCDSKTTMWCYVHRRYSCDSCAMLSAYITDAKKEAQKRGRISGQPLNQWIASLDMNPYPRPFVKMNAVETLESMATDIRMHADAINADADVYRVDQVEALEREAKVIDRCADAIRSAHDPNLHRDVVSHLAQAASMLINDADYVGSTSRAMADALKVAQAWLNTAR